AEPVARGGPAAVPAPLPDFGTEHPQLGRRLKAEAHDPALDADALGGGLEGRNDDFLGQPPREAENGPPLGELLWSRGCGPFAAERPPCRTRTGNPPCKHRLPRRARGRRLQELVLRIAGVLVLCIPLLQESPPNPVCGQLSTNKFGTMRKAESNRSRVEDDGHTGTQG